MSKINYIQSPDAPKPIGPYFPAVRAGDFLFVSGQIGLDPKTGTLVKGDITAEVQMALANLLAILKAAGAHPGQIVKSSLFLTDMADFHVVNPLYAAIFEGNNQFPARETVAVKALPAGASFEISCTVFLG